MVRYLHHADHQPGTIRKVEKLYGDKLDFKDIKFPVKVREKCCEDRHVDLLLIEERSKKHYVLIKDFNTFMYDYILYCGRKYFYRYCSQVFRSEDAL